MIFVSKVYYSNQLKIKLDVYLTSSFHICWPHITDKDERNDLIKMYQFCLDL